MRLILSFTFIILLNISSSYSQTHQLNKAFIEQLESKKINANEVQELIIQATDKENDIATNISEGYQKLELLGQLKNLKKLEFKAFTLGYSKDTIISFDPETFAEQKEIVENHSEWSPYLIFPALEELTQLKELHLDFGDNVHQQFFVDDIFWTIYSLETEKEMNTALKACLDEKGIDYKPKWNLWKWVYLYDYFNQEEGNRTLGKDKFMDCYTELFEANKEWKDYARLRGRLTYLKLPTHNIEILIYGGLPKKEFEAIQANNKQYLNQLKRDQRVYKDAKNLFIQKTYSTLFANKIKPRDQWFLEILPKLKNLEVLSIKNNYSIEIEPLIKALVNLPKLKTLEIKSCRIEEIPKGIKKLKNLDKLDLSDNHLSIHSKSLNSLNIRQLNTAGNPFVDLVTDNVLKESFDQYAILNYSAKMYAWFAKKDLKETENDFEFEGMLTSPSMNIKVGKATYDYENHDIYLDDARYIQFYAPNYEPVQSKLEVNKGVLILDIPSNRLGLRLNSVPYLPSLETLVRGNIYYEEHNAWGKEAYPATSFHISVEPFIIDSLWKPLDQSPITACKLYSDICEPLDGQLQLMEDNSLGMIHEAANPLRVYEKKYKNPYLLFQGTLTVSNQGVLGKGSFMYKSWAVNSDEILFLNDNFYVKNPTSSTGTFPKDVKKDTWWMYDLEAKKWVQKNPAE